MIAIITSKDCPAGKNIKQNLLDNYNFKEIETFEGNPIYQIENIKLYTINQKHIYAENLDKEIKADVFIFATTHRSKSNINSLSVHPIGNWNEAKLGGKEKTLVLSPSNYLKQAFKIINEKQLENYEYTTEATHHGPYLETPTMFIEIGSGQKQWEDKKAGKIIADTIMETTKSVKENRSAVLFGGTHYNIEVNKILLQTNMGISHVCPKFQIDNLDKETILQSFKKSYPEAKLAIIDWKGASKEQRDKLIQIFRDANIPWKKSKEVRK